MKLNVEQKKALADKLSVPWGLVELMCDGYKVSLHVQPTKDPLKYRVETYVNGFMKGEWFLPSKNAPESKFMRKSVRPNVTPAKKAKAEKILGKRAVKNDPYFSGSITIYVPDWPSGKAAISHLSKVCTSVQLCSELDDATQPGEGCVSKPKHHRLCEQRGYNPFCDACSDLQGD